MKFVNLTPHAIVVINGEGIATTFGPSGKVARVTTVTQIAEFSDSRAAVPIYKQKAGEVEGLPEKEACCCFCGALAFSAYDSICSDHPAEQPEPTGYIVSAMVRLAMTTRNDVFSPGELLRDDKGQPVGCKGLVAN